MKFGEFAEMELKSYTKNLSYYREHKNPLSFLMIRLECERGHRNKTAVPFGKLSLETYEAEDEIMSVGTWEHIEQLETNKLNELVQFFRKTWDDVNTAIMNRAPRCPACGAKMRVIGVVALFLLEGKPVAFGTSEKGTNIAMRLESDTLVHLPRSSRPIFELIKDYIG